MIKARKGISRNKKFCSKTRRAVFEKRSVLDVHEHSKKQCNAVLDKRDISRGARKRFGQNFLHDSDVIRHIVAEINPVSTDHIAEIGPGLGALTVHLLPIVAKMDAIELDRDLIPELHKTCQKLGYLNIYQNDALLFNFCSLVGEGEKVRVVGNLPYNISTPLLFHLLTQLNCVCDMHFMLQNEVVDRIVAQPGCKQYGRLSVMLQYFCRCEKLFMVKPEAFTPAPKVNSAFMRLVPYDVIPYQKTDVSNLERVVKVAFSQRRKTVSNTLKSIITADELVCIDIDPKARAEQLSIDEFVQISNVVCREKS